MRAPLAALGAITLLLSACAPPSAALSPTWLLQAAEAGQGLPAGAIAGSVRRLDGPAFQPAAAVTVTLEDGSKTLTDARGAFAFDRLSPGAHALTATAPGCHPIRLTIRLPEGAGLGRVRLPLVPLAAPEGLPADGVVLAGVVTDGAGAAVPSAILRCVDSASESGRGANQTWQADADGYYLGTLLRPAPGPGVASITAYGRTPDGAAVETSTIHAVPLAGGRTQALVVVAGRRGL